jgi:hypothetical protein
MKIAIILDPLDGIETYKDATYSMMVEAASRGHEYLLVYSRKRCHFCPSRRQERVVEFGDWFCMDGMSSKRFLTGISYSASRKSSVFTYCSL